ncbi:putative sugar isomerase YihS [Aquimixticola soesokkakensis]|uniref:Putative sugar isomerase YihS n=1 Tax=Aquimixticola soesokkakensis TaxID=1519096 RepID=A0A1Y5SYY4_9RHOB|nr:AGE family epimerase/isomerase [Aquimixticola soesokkakensis]SLN48338.1 putative sugar isomerase YihS [Aquimixticola soesokkakensis]
MTQPDLSQSRYRGAWLATEAQRLLDFHAGSLAPEGGFAVLDRQGRPLPASPRALHETCRMVHSYAIAAPLGHLMTSQVVDHGLTYLLESHFDAQNGGFIWSLDANGPLDTQKQAYGHAFVLLAASSAGRLGHPKAAVLRDHALAALEDHFRDDTGLVADTFAADWSAALPYRGMNANMHLTEALLAAYATWGQQAVLDWALHIATFFIDRQARAANWVVPEHFHTDWTVDRSFDGDAMFRPSGTTPGHAIEWARLLVELHSAHPTPPEWLIPAAQALFERAMREAWLATGGLAYTLDWDGSVSRDWRFWWPCAEAIGAAYRLGQVTGKAQFFEAYERVWAFADTTLIDHENGGWFHEVDAAGVPKETVFAGKPDIYHALQACLIPLEAELIPQIT